MEGKIIAPKLSEELAQLYAELPEAHRRAEAAFNIGRTGSILEGDALEHFLVEEERVSTITRRISEILGIAGEPQDGWASSRATRYNSASSSSRVIHSFVHKLLKKFSTPWG